ncbi:MAG TPA: alpha/beta fold hydrolase [Longimicrobiaceae bacterium]|nr:alpha/beta fold hydrolase [Longimicrobiaceae bacterium]
MHTRSVAFALLLPAFLLLAPSGSAAQVSTTGGLEEPIELVTPTGSIHGTLLLPAEGGVQPVVLIIAGSGPTDRDGNNPLLPGQNNSLKLLAEGLAEQGIASVRYDKRGVAASTGAATDESDLRFDTYVEDAAGWIGKLESDPRFSSVSIVGHSEGSLIGMLAADRAGADSFVSIAGIARPASEVLRDQLRPQLPPNLWAESERILESLEAGRMADSVPATLAMLYRESVQPYLISWFAYNPAEVIASLDIPILIAQGSTDIQVGVAEAHQLHAAKPDAELVIIEGMNHVLKEVPADPASQQASYSDPLLPVVPELIDSIAAFIHTAADRRPSDPPLSSLHPPLLIL